MAYDQRRINQEDAVMAGQVEEAQKGNKVGKGPQLSKAEKDWESKEKRKKIRKKSPKMKQIKFWTLRLIKWVSESEVSKLRKTTHL